MTVRAIPVVRDATQGDAEFIVDANLAMAFETEGARLDRGVLNAGVESVLADAQRGFYLVAVAAERPLGCLLVTHEWSDWRNGWWWWLQSVYVARDVRQQGTFDALHAEVVRRARRTPGVIGLRLYVAQSNGAAQAVYRKRAMEETVYRVYEHLLVCDA
jgi:GNAT superfamily N-acetyltransferase